MPYSVFHHLNGHAFSHVALKDLNRKKEVVAHLTSMGESTMLELADLLNISVPKTTELITDLSKEGLVIATGRKTEGLGRKATIYMLNPNSCYFLGIEIRKYEINIGIMSFNAHMVESALNIPFSYPRRTTAVHLRRSGAGFRGRAATPDRGRRPIDRRDAG